MKKVSKLVLSAAVVGVFAGCGGGDDGIDLGAPSIVACFSAPKTVKYKLKATNTPAGLVSATSSTVGPMTYNNQAVTGQVLFYQNGTTDVDYWLVTKDGVAGIATVTYTGSTYTTDMVFHPDMRPGEKATGTIRNASGTYTLFNTLVGFEPITLADKVFPNACHIKEENSRDTTTGDIWYAPGYGLIKRVDATDGWTLQYDGDL
ncbi:MAG: hypothetical protein LBE78_01885 [Burkholderiaceae bacterium]|jgi:hypothetical protein|nr:hypothetical protein [Burkholderiaceae bacterium]